MRLLTSGCALTHGPRIKKRLMALGWTEQDMVFPKDTEKAWLTQLNHDTPFTEKRKHTSYPLVHLLTF